MALSTTSSSKFYSHHPTLPAFSPSIHLHHRTSFLLRSPRRLRRISVAGGPPSSPGPDPPPPENTTQLAGLVRSVTRIQDRVKIFLAVLFWMFLFFWVTVTDGRGKGKGKKGSRFK
ncbi:unnamed protein product [Microthlaspi erraticum]|uniref:Transmembrane protein n=1 Tax=Microthlaspi erraticum TaxID=1685480 RepID=A0A6D2L0D5_9BRAS|nr:unnamed protein product [Microthlaspi erraticum]